MTSVSEYLWVQDCRQCAISEAGCVTIVPQKHPGEVLSAFGADVFAVSRTTTDTGADWDWDWEGGPLVAPVEVPGAVIIVENNQFQGTCVEVLAAASRAGTAFSIFWNAYVHSQVSYAEDGELIVAFEALDPDQRSGSDPDRLLPLMRDLRFRHPGETIPAAFALAERVTGIRVTPELINSACETWL